MQVSQTSRARNTCRRTQLSWDRQFRPVDVAPVDWRSVSSIAILLCVSPTTGRPGRRTMRRPCWLDGITLSDDGENALDIFQVDRGNVHP